ncbi:hypothetical protein [Allokutzneria oryzae]|uniref:Uncharacterized protein n=1 Tax=Allokutzneria oryzae TaxID=1378989 RepID=A0ABV5ZZE8_9PSEU
MPVPDPDTTTPQAPARQAGAWLVWHAGELAGIAVPLVLSATTHPALAVVSVAVAIRWAVHEHRQAAEAAQARQAGNRRPFLDSTSPTTTDSGQEASA